MSTVYLIRHGEIAGRSKEHRFIGRLDLPLSELGREQMHRLAGHPCLQTVGKVLSSPLLRCRESAAILSSHLNCAAVEIIPDLAEIDLGDWEGMTVGEITNRFPGEYAARGKDLAGFRPGNGESFDGLLHRCWPVFERLTTCHDIDLAVVAHAGVNRVLLCRILAIPLGDLFRLPQDYGCCNIIYADDRKYRLGPINLLPGDPL